MARISRFEAVILSLVVRCKRFSWGDALCAGAFIIVYLIASHCWRLVCFVVSFGVVYAVKID